MLNHRTKARDRRSRRTLTVKDTSASAFRRIHYFDLMSPTSVDSESVSFSPAKRQEFTVQGHRFIWLTQAEMTQEMGKE